MKMKTKKTNVRANKATRKKRHFDGQEVHHRDRTVTLWVAFPTDTLAKIKRVVKRLGTSREAFLRCVVEWRLAREIWEADE